MLSALVSFTHGILQIWRYGTFQGLKKPKCHNFKHGFKMQKQVVVECT